MNLPPCPCGKPLTLPQCCGRYLVDFDGTPAPDAESLMRSRYCAFVLLNKDYLLSTWHPEHRPTDLQLDPATKWLGLDVRARKQIDATHAEVEFVARCRSTGPSTLRQAQGERNSGRAERLHERSRFVKENGRWYYLDGEML